MRTSRTVVTSGSNTAYRYVYNGSLLMQEVIKTTTGTGEDVTVTTDTLNYFYDASGLPLTVTYNGTIYYYVTNLQGDVVALVNTSGTAVVNYTYDAWGNILSTTGTLANTLGTANALRYRSYVYDTETEFYYLQSRYYNPEIGRFLNPDIVYDTDAGLQGYNLFAYCGNNPVNRIDISGTDSVDLIDGDEEPEYKMYGGGGGNGKISSNPNTPASYASSAGISSATAQQSATIAQQLQSCANQVNTAIVGKGAIVGTAKHSMFKALVDAESIPNLRTEVSYIDQVEVPYGTKGSIRFDVVLIGADSKPIMAWDFKTGNAVLSASRIAQMHQKSGWNIPIYMIK